MANKETKNKNMEKTPLTLYKSRSMYECATNTTYPFEDVNNLHTRVIDLGNGKTERTVCLGSSQTPIAYFSKGTISKAFYSSTCRVFDDFIIFLNKVNGGKVNINACEDKPSIKTSAKCFSSLPEVMQDITFTITEDDIAEYITEVNEELLCRERNNPTLCSPEYHRARKYIKEFMELLFSNSYVYSPDMGEEGKKGLDLNRLSKTSLGLNSLKIKSLSEDDTQFKGKYENIKKIVVTFKNKFSPLYYLSGLVSSLKVYENNVDSKFFNDQNLHKNMSISNEEMEEAINVLCKELDPKNKDTEIFKMAAYEKFNVGFLERVRTWPIISKFVNSRSLLKRTHIEVEIYNKDFTSIKNILVFPGFKPEDTENNDALYLSNICKLIKSFGCYKYIKSATNGGIKSHGEAYEEFRRIVNAELAYTPSLYETMYTWSRNAIKESVLNFFKGIDSKPLDFFVSNITIEDKETYNGEVFLHRNDSNVSNLNSMRLYFSNSEEPMLPTEELAKIVRDLSNKSLITYACTEDEVDENEDVFETYNFLGFKAKNYTQDRIDAEISKVELEPMNVSNHWRTRCDIAICRIYLSFKAKAYVKVLCADKDSLTEKLDERDIKITFALTLK